MKEYNHKKIEEKWKDKWLEDNIYKAVDFSEKPKKYILVEFPYPSGKSLHPGHLMRYTVPDVYSRYLRMKGFNVLFPVGWDAFGLPAENYAIQTGVHPEKITLETISKFKESFLKMGYGVDWDREISTCDPNYYKWTQWLFLKFFENGLAEYKETSVWWCEELKTVLADEEVLTDKDGNKISERGGHPVNKRMLKQWVLKIPEYAEKLLEGLEEVDFPESIKSAQRNWIGKSEGANISFEIEGKNIEVFTTRPDTIYGATFMAFAPEHPFIKEVMEKVENKNEVQEYINQTKNKSDIERQAEKEKTGVILKGVQATVPFSNKKIPIFIADYVLMGYGTGVIMAVPAHDERDFDFAKKYGIDIIEVIKSGNDDKSDDNEPYTGAGIMVNSGNYDGMDSEEFKEIVIKKLEEIGKGKGAINYKIRDWVFSRQRYWGEPIPLVHTEDGIKEICDTENTKEVQNTLPLTLPDVPDFNPSEDGSSPLERNKEWVDINFNGKPAKRETNTMPNWAGSCWYYIRYLDPNNSEKFADEDKMKYWLPVDRYFGGSEHTTLHLLYSRFWHKFFYDIGIVPTKEPYKWRLNGGLMLAEDGSKLSKSKGNGIDVLDQIETFGADALRATVCFMGPYDETYPWNPSIIKTINKLIRNICDLQGKVTKDKSSEEILKSYNLMVKNISEMIENLKMNTGISEIMVFVKQLQKENEIGRDVWDGFLRVLSVFTPFVAEDLWQEFKNFNEWKPENSVHLQRWPEFDKNYTHNDIITIPIQINGKVRSEIEIDINDSEDKIKEKVFSDGRVKQHINGKDIKKIIYIKGKIFNIVL